MRLRSLVSFGVVAGAALLLSPAFAGGWSAFNAAFPAQPCPDGWAGCLIGDAVVTPGMSKDAAGRPIPSDSRIGWFDLRPTVVFSPFSKLSVYSGALGGAVAAVEPVAEPERVEPERVEPERVEPERVEVARVDPAPRPPPPQPARFEPAPVVAKAAPAPAPTPPPPVAKPASAPVPAPVAKVAPAPTPTAKPVPAAPVVAAKTAEPVPPPVMKPVAPLTAPVATDDSCADLVRLEPQAMLGQLRPGQVKCIDARIGTEGAQTTKDKLSRVLIANAEGKGDKVEWERLVKRHLEDVDRSDPDMCFKYATQLSRGGTGRAPGVIRWADYALENKQRWSGTTYTKRVTDLYRLKTEAANKLWTEADNNYATKDHTEENGAKAEKWRGQTKDFAREWLDFAKASGQETKNAVAICVSASGNSAFCGG